MDKNTFIKIEYTDIDKILSTLVTKIEYKNDTVNKDIQKIIDVGVNDYDTII